jgi:Muramidase (flagellum-specific)
MKMMYLLKLLPAILIFLSLNIYGQQGDSSYDDYIREFSYIAVEEMAKYNIPASITLAQGLLESGAGKSRLALLANNHFGIKCGSDWNGPFITHDDDAKGERFRQYTSAKQSFEDHSKFLTGRPWYAKLFELKITDYKGWAQGLSDAGYATDKAYPAKLINIIERYKLHEYDRYTASTEGAGKGDEGGNKGGNQGSENKGGENKGDYENIGGGSIKEEVVAYHQRYITNEVPFIIVREGDTFDLLEKEFNIKRKRLLLFNDLQKDYRLKVNDVIYLKTKKKKAVVKYPVHIMVNNESLHDISQHYAIRLKDLISMNKRLLRKDRLQVGDRVKLR